MVEAAVFEKLQGSLIHILNIIDNLPEDTLEAGWTREATPVNPSLAEIDVG